MWCSGCECECKKTIVLPVPKNKYSQYDNFILDDALVDGILDFTHTSKLSMQSIDQQGCGTYTLSDSIKWTWDTDLRDRKLIIHISL